MLATNITSGQISPNRPLLRPAATHIGGRDVAGALGSFTRLVALRQGGPFFIPAPSIAGFLAAAMNEIRGNGRDAVRTASSGERDGTAGIRSEAGIAAAFMTDPAPSARRRRRPKAPNRAPRDPQEKCEE
jgi:hypothetical protein